MTPVIYVSPIPNAQPCQTNSKGSFPSTHPQRSPPVKHIPKDHSLPDNKYAQHKSMRLNCRLLAVDCDDGLLMKAVNHGNGRPRLDQRALPPMVPTAKRLHKP